MSKIATKIFYTLCFTFLVGSNLLAKDMDSSGNPRVIMDTSEGKIIIELFKDKSPVSVKNFLQYVESGHYDGTIFHRVIAGFMIQGGGFTRTWEKRATRSPIKNEAKNGLRNKRGSIAMARTGVVDSATSQFFINLVDNHALDHGARDYGYAVFGEVVDGMNVVHAMGRARTTSKQGRRDVPVTDIVIRKVTVAP